MSRLPRPALAVQGEWSDAARSGSDVAPIACIRGVSNIGQAQRRCASLTPRIGRLPDGSDGLELDLRGCERLLLGGRFAIAGADVAETAAEAEWPGLAAALHRWLANDAMRDDAGPRVGVGPSRTVAWLAATVPEPLGRAWRAVAPTQLAAFLGPLPLAVLGSAPGAADLPEVDAALDALAHGGVSTVGQLMRLPPLALRRRFDSVGAALALFAAGGDLAPLHAIVPEAWCGVKLPCDPPLATEHIAGTLPTLAGRVAEALAERQLAAGVVALVLHPDRGPARQLDRRLRHPVASPGALLGQARRLLRRHLTEAQPASTDVLGRPHGDGPPGELVTAVQLRAGGLRAATLDQLRLWRAEASRRERALRCERLADALDALADAGQPGTRLLRAAPSDLDAALPEERYRFEPFSRTPMR